jgi:hypothetical protein
MTYDKIIEAIEKDQNCQYHFEDYEFSEALNIKCPRPESTEFLKEAYFSLMNGLKEYLKTEPTKELLETFILDSVRKLDPSKFLLEEFQLLILKFNVFNHFFLGIGTAKEYFDMKRDEFDCLNLK